MWRSPPGKRETQRLRTRAALRANALKRFGEFGFDKTSVADIARDAGVTERTFYRHYASKEEVLFQDFESRVEWFRAALDVRPDDEPILDSVRIAVESFPDDREVVRQVAQLRANLLSRESIDARLREVQGEFAREIERHVARRIGSHDDPELIAAVLGNAISAALLAALDVWGKRGGGSTDDLRELTHKALALLRDPPPEITEERGGR